MKFKTQRAFHIDGIEFIILDGNKVCTGFTFEERIAGSHNPDSVFSLSMNEAQILIDSLWDSGVRPTEGSGSAGSLKATEKHLDDMRTIVSKELNVQFLNIPSVITKESK